MKQNATGLNNGTSWANAFNSFDSLTTYIGDSSIRDSFWVANGIYKQNANGWQLGPGVLRIYGGFTGTETAFSQRNWSGFQTILDGDSVSGSIWALLNVVMPGGPNPNTPVHPDMHIDGFKFKNCYGRPALWYRYGGGETVEVANCLFTQNTVFNVGTNFNEASSTLIIGDHTNGVNLTMQFNIKNCHFENNYSSIYGGAIGTYHIAHMQRVPASKYDIKVQISDCSFSNNMAAYGGAIANMDSAVSMTISRCIFKGNSATESGGAIYDTLYCKAAVYNSLFVGNSAPKSSVWQQSTGPSVTAAPPRKLIGCTIADNKNTASSSTDYAIVLNGKDSIENGIFWDNATGSGQQINPGPGSYINTNIIQGGLAGSLATINLNPLFVSPGSSSAAPFPGTTAYDYHLASASPAIDLGLTNIVAPPGMNNTDLDGNARTYGPAPDLGAYEQSYCLLPTVRITPTPVYICLASADSMLLTASGGAGAGTYTWIGRGVSGGGAYKSSSIWAKDSGMYQVMSYDTATGCRGQGSVYVRVVPQVKPVITITFNTLSVPAVYSSYQWYKNGVIINGATSNTYTATTNGLYSIWVMMRAAECQDSASYDLKNLGLSPTTPASGLLGIYPNPTSGLFRLTVDAAAAARYITITITDLTGRTLQEQSHTGNARTFSTELDLSGQAPGIYFVKVNMDGRIMTAKVLLE